MTLLFSVSRCQEWQNSVDFWARLGSNNGVIEMITAGG